MKRFASFLISILASTNAWGQDQEVNWIAYGSAPAIDGKSSLLCFYDEKGIAGLTDSQIRVWTKCLQQDALDNFNTNEGDGGKVLQAAAKKIAVYYIPPMAKIFNSLNQDQTVALTLSEQIADFDLVKRELGILYQIDCSDRRIRELEIFFQKNGKDQSSSGPLDWKYIAPETNANNLRLLACPQS